MIKMIIGIGSTNAAKVSAVKKACSAFGSSVSIVSASVSSGVSDQPFSDEETIQGAINRANNVLNGEHTDIGIGLEGGVVETAQGLFLCNWGALIAKNSAPIIAGGARIPLPDEIANRLRAGEELGPVMDSYAKRKNVRKQEGAIGIFTNELVSRGKMFVHVMELLIGQYLYQKRNQ